MSAIAQRLPRRVRASGGFGRLTRFGAILGLVPLAVGIAAWQLFGDPLSTSFPPPSEWITAIRVMYEEGVLMPAVGRTLLTFFLSLLVATVLGAALGAVIGASARVDRALTPLMDIFRALPPPAIVPVAGLVLGATLQMGVTVVVLAIIWPILLNTASAMRAIPPVRREMARALGLGPAASLWKVVLPSLLPGIGLGVKLAVSISLIVTLLVDILGSGEGVGLLILERQQTFDAAGVWGLLAIIGVFGYVINAVVSAGEARLLRNWSVGRR